MNITLAKNSSYHSQKSCLKRIIIKTYFAWAALACLADFSHAATPESPTLPRHFHRQLPPPAHAPTAHLHPHAKQALTTAYSGTPIDVTTYHYDNFRTGWNSTESELTPATVSSSQFGLIQSLPVDGNVFAQPLLVSGLTLPDGTTHDVLLIATGHNTLYAYDAQDYSLLWSRSLGISQSSADVGCGDVQPEYGISSTPVIVRNSASSATVYVVAATEPMPYEFHSQLHAIELATGADVQAIAEINPSAQLSNGSPLNFDEQHQWSRAGLAWGNQSLYVGIGSHCDINYGAISGWLLRYGADLAPLASFHTVSDQSGYELASIWMSGFAPAIDTQGSVYVVTGNGAFDIPYGGHNYGESVLKIAPDLSSVTSSFTPSIFNHLNEYDLDFGSAGTMLIPAATRVPLMVAMGKDPTLYVLNRNKLGGLKPHDIGSVQSLKTVSDGYGAWGGPAYFEGANGPTVLYQTDNDVLRAYQVLNQKTGSLSAGITGNSQGGYGGSLPIVSSNGSTAHTGIVWLVRRASTVELEAYDAEVLGDPIFSAGISGWANSESNAFVTAMQANGRVYVGAYGTVSVFGLVPAAPSVQQH